MNALATALGLEGFRFAEPRWSALLWGVAALIALLAWRERRGGGELSQLVAPALQDALVQRLPRARRTLQIALIALACAAFVFALMRPQWGARQIAATRAGAELMIALDVSRSMLAEDVAPSRLERAKAEILDLLAYLEGDQVGLIAFAGRASVLSPLTPDFGFLRLALENAGPHSVTRGGTRLEEPIRRAVAGFGPPGPAQRALLLITDGEDHDSFVDDAVDEAAEAGVAIIAIGFGDEAGSPIYVRDARTGARQAVLDDDGNPVQSRLDGALLRELALKTGGAYVPAGTGVLDLESIYEAHLARLVRGASDRGGRIVHDEGYPWFLLVGLLSLAASLVAGLRLGASAAARAPETRAHTGRSRPSARTTRAAAVLCFFAAVGAALPSGPARAQPATPAPGSDASEAPAPLDDPWQGEPEAGAAAAPSEERSPRELYNAAVRALEAGEATNATRLFADARRAAPDDFELRYRATYNLGVATVAAARTIERDDPRAALARLREAADWFRQAVEVRPDDADARHNLEVTLRKALVLEDMLAKQNQEELDAALARLADAQRALAGAAAGLVHALAAEDDPNAAMQVRPAFRAQATREREIASDANRLFERTTAEHAALLETPEAEGSPQDAMRAAQLEGVLHYLHRAVEKLGQTRRELRRQRAERAYRRASDAIVEIERARDQLRMPDRVIDALMRELAALRERSAALALSDAKRPALDMPGAHGDEDAGAAPAEPTPPEPDLPAWITASGLAEDQRALGMRTGELGLRLRSGIEHAIDEPVEDPEAQALVETLREAEPHIARAEVEQNEAAAALDGEQARRAVTAQTRALEALAEARELFLPLERLIDVAHADQRRIRAVLTPEAEPDGLSSMLAALRTAQARNLERSERIERELQRELEQLERRRAEADSAAPPPGAAAPGTPSPEEMAQREQQLTAASQLMTQVFGGMEGARDALEADPLAVGEAASEAQRAVRALDALRWLFLTAAERVRELAQAQTELGDATRDALVLGADPQAGDTNTAAARLAPLLPAQESLGERSETLADELLAHSEERAAAPTAPTPPPGPAPGPAASSGPDAESIRLAAEHVMRAAGAMQDAHTALGAAPLRGEDGRKAQDEAVAALLEALRLLQPPPQDGDQDPQQQDQQQQQQNEGANDPPEPEPTDDEQSADAARTLQGVLDREAQRQRERAERARRRSEPVEHDW